MILGNRYYSRSPTGFVVQSHKTVSNTCSVLNITEGWGEAYPSSVRVNGTFNVAPFPHVFESPGSRGWLTESLGTQEVTEIILLEGLTHTFGSERIQTIRVFIKGVFRYSCKCKREAKFSASLY